jgi:hypothetical protein
LRKIGISTFLFFGIGAIFSGCMGTYWKGNSETVETQPLPAPGTESPGTQPSPSDTAASPDIRMPIYEDEKSPMAWAPDLRPLPRACWALHPPKSSRLRPMGKITKITIHHEGNPQPNTSETPAEAAADLRLIWKVHVDQNNAGDIGYHYIIDRGGRIWEGRSLRYAGAHAGGAANDGNIGVMLLGNFDIQDPTEKQKTCLRTFLKLLAERFGLNSRNIFTHREIKPTRCPGDRLQAFVNQIRKPPV